MEFLNTKTAKDIVSLTTQPKILEAGFELDENYMYALTPGNAEKAKNGMDDAKASYAEYYNEKKKNLVNYTKDESGKQALHPENDKSSYPLPSIHDKSYRTKLIILLPDESAA